MIPATGKRRNPPPQEQQGRPYLRTHVRTRDVACVMTRHVPSARGARALLEPSDVPRSARQDEQREGAGDRRTEITTPRAWMCGLADLDADRKARSDGRRDDHEGQLTNRGVNPDDPALGRAMSWVGCPEPHVRDPLSCQWSGQRRSVVFASKDTGGGSSEARDRAASSDLTTSQKRAEGRTSEPDEATASLLSDILMGTAPPQRQSSTSG